MDFGGRVLTSGALGGLGFRTWSLQFRSWGLRFTAWSLRLRFQGVWFRFVGVRLGFGHCFWLKIGGLLSSGISVLVLEVQDLGPVWKAI